MRCALPTRPSDNFLMSIIVQERSSTGSRGRSIGGAHGKPAPAGYDRSPLLKFLITKYASRSGAISIAYADILVDDRLLLTEHVFTRAIDSTTMIANADDCLLLMARVFM